MHNVLVLLGHIPLIKLRGIAMGNQIALAIMLYMLTSLTAVRVVAVMAGQ